MLIILRNATFFHVSSRVHSSLNVGKYMIYIYIIFFILKNIFFILKEYLYILLLLET